MERELRDLVARSYLSVGHAAALVQIEAAHGAVEQARGRLDELISSGLETLRPDMLFVWTLAELARGCVALRATRHAPRLYQALAPYAGRAVVAAGAVLCAGSADYYLAGLAALSGDAAAADRHYRAAPGGQRRLGARPMLAHTLHEHARLLRPPAGLTDPPAASAALTEARAIAADCGMTRLLAVLEQPGQPGSPLTLNREDGFWLIGYADTVIRVPDSLGLRYLDLLARNPGRELTALELVRLAGASGPGRTVGPADGLQQTSGAPPTTSSTGKPGPPTGSVSPTSVKNSPKPSGGTTASEPAPRRERFPGPRARGRDRTRRPAAAARLGIRTSPDQRHPGHQDRDRQDPRPRPGRGRPPRPSRPDRDPLLLLPAGPAVRGPLVTVGLRLVRAVDGNADVVRLLLGQLAQPDPERVQVQPGYLLV